MSIATRINAIEEHIGNAYEKIEDLGIDLTNVDKNIDNISDMLEEVWEEYPKVTGTGTEVTLNNTKAARMNVGLTGRTEQESTSGKQLLPFTNQDFTVGNVRFYVQDGSLYLSGTSTGETSSTNQNFKNNFSFTLAAGTYYFTRGNLTTTSTYLKKVSDNTNLVTNSGSFTLAEEAEVYLGFYIYNKTYDNINSEIMLNIGSTAESYEKYTYGVSPNPSYPQEIKNTGDSGTINEKVQNKNLAWNGWAEDFVSRIANSNVASIETYDNRRCLKFLPQAGYPDYDTKYLFKTNWKENTRYTIVFDKFNTDTTNIITVLYTDGTKATIGGSVPSNTWAKVIYNTQDNKTVKYIHVAYYSGTRYIDLDTFMVLEGVYSSSNIPAYTAHTEQNISFPLAQGQKLMQGDYLADDGVHHVRGEVVLDGTSRVSKSGTSAIDRYEILFSWIGISVNSNSSNFKSNYFHFVTTSTNIIGQFWKNGSSSGLYFDFASAGSTTNDDFKAWLAEQYTNGTPVKVQYELAEEVIDPYTEEQATVWEQIKALKSYDEVTIINSTDETPAILTVAALMKGE